MDEIPDRIIGNKRASKIRSSVIREEPTQRNGNCNGERHDRVYANCK